MIKDDLFMHSIGDESVVFTQDGEEVFALNEAATVILDIANQGRGIDDIAQALAQKFGDSEEKCKAIAEKFLHELSAKGLVAESNL